MGYARVIKQFINSAGITIKNIALETPISVKLINYVTKGTKYFYEILAESTKTPKCCRK